jgi:hypothetical protein
VSESTDLSPRAAIAGLLTVLVLDRLVLPRLPLRPSAGVVDEAAHLATGAVVLAALGEPADGPFARGLAAGSVLIDVDHVPELWDRRWLRLRGVRPLPHTLLTPAVVAARARTPFGRGAAVGLAAHLMRDLATGKTRVALLWPLTRRPFSIRYRTYVGVLALLVAFARRVKASRDLVPPPRASHPGSPPPPAPRPVPGERQDPGAP